MGDGKLEIPTPKPSTNQVLIKIHASGICYTNVHITHGILGVDFPKDYWT
jgi:D-arabinose 1-dehydrogenase-like Zn-dependent alcohol dehydrogenase